MSSATTIRKYGEPSAAFLIFGLFVGYLGLCCFTVRWGGDIHLYVAALRSLYADLWNPGHETLPISGVYSDLYSPYVVALGAVGRVFQLTEYRALQYAGVFNVIFYALAVIWFFRTHSSNKPAWLPASLFLLVSTLLHNDYYHWSSELNLRTLATIQAYPSFCAWGVALVSFTACSRFLSGAGCRILLALSALVWFLLLSHPLTGSWTIGILGVQGLLALIQGAERAKVARFYAAVAIGAGLTFLWPYFDFRSLVDISIVHDTSQPFAGKPFQAMRWMYALAVFAALYLITSRQGVLLLLGFASTFLAYLLARHVLNIDFIERYIFFQAFFAQAAVAETAAVGLMLLFKSKALVNRQQVKGTGYVARTLIGGFGILVLLAVSLAPATHKAYESGLIKSPRQLFMSKSSHNDYYGEFEELKSVLDSSTIVIASWGGEDLAAITGARLIFSRVALRTPGYVQRSQDIQRFFSEAANRAERQDIVTRYRATHIALRSPAIDLTQAIAEQFGAPVLANEGFTIFALE